MEQEFTAATMTTKVRFTGAQRINILSEINLRPHNFANAGKYAPVWEAVLGEWDWDELARDMRKAALEANTPVVEGEAEAAAARRAEAQAEVAAHEKYVDDCAKSETEIEIKPKVAAAICDLIKEKLESANEEPPEGRDTRWRGRAALIMHSLHEKLSELLGEK